MFCRQRQILITSLPTLYDHLQEELHKVLFGHLFGSVAANALLLLGVCLIDHTHHLIQHSCLFLLFKVDNENSGKPYPV